eukprot:evm.model.scf_521.2 EVM.evm.TU.scf_521.2   scf_521:9475-13474(+)
MLARALGRSGCRRELCPLLAVRGIGSQRALCAAAGDKQGGSGAPVNEGVKPQEGAEPKDSGIEQEAAEGEDAGGAGPGDGQPGDKRPVFGYYEAAHVPGRYPTRAEIGSFADPGTLDYELKHDVPAFDDTPGADPLYDLGEWLKKHAPEAAPTPHIKGLLGKALEDEDIKKLAAYLYNAEERVKASDKPSIFRWEVQFVLDPGNTYHPANRKVKMRVYLKELQRAYQLSDDAIQHVIRICQNRYNPNKGELTLVSEKYAHREDNRRHIMETVASLIEEGHSKFPAEAQEGGEQTPLKEAPRDDAAVHMS